MPLIDYYAVLSVSSDATAAEVKGAYRSLTRTTHPDRNPGKEATAQMQLLNEAYMILREPEKRQAYDEEYRAYRRWSENQRERFDSEYVVRDETLNEWINQAAEKARMMGVQILEDSKELLGVAGKELGKNVVIYGVLMLLFYWLVILFARHNP